MKPDSSPAFVMDDYRPYGRIEIKRTSTGYFYARGTGPCEWAQWPCSESLRDEHFFPEASRAFRRALFDRASPAAAPGMETDE